MDSIKLQKAVIYSLRQASTSTHHVKILPAVQLKYCQYIQSWTKKLHFSTSMQR